MTRCVTHRLDRACGWWTDNQGFEELDSPKRLLSTLTRFPLVALIKNWFCGSSGDISPHQGIATKENAIKPYYALFPSPCGAQNEVDTSQGRSLWFTFLPSRCVNPIKWIQLLFYVAVATCFRLFFEPEHVIGYREAFHLCRRFQLNLTRRKRLGWWICNIFKNNERRISLVSSSVFLSHYK